MKVLDREVVFKALVGSHNYNLATETSDKDYKVFVTPIFEELYRGEEFSKSIIGDTEDNDIHDIRKITNLFYKANINFLEVLASKEIIIPEGNPEIKELLSLKDEIFKMNLPYFFNACKGMHYNKMKLLDKGTEGTQYLVDKYGYDTKQAQHAYRVMNVIVRFEATNFTDFKGAISYSGEELEFMKNIRNGYFTKDAFERFAKHYYESTFIHLEEKYKQQQVNEELKQYIDNLIMSLVKRKIIEG